MSERTSGLSSDGEDDRCSGVLHGAPFCGSIASTKKAPGGKPEASMPVIANGDDLQPP